MKYSSGKKIKAKKMVVKNMNIRNALKDKYYSNVNKRAYTPSEDTINRKQIHAKISEMLEQGICQEEILIELNRLFNDPKYDPYKKYFEKWIDDRLTRMAKHTTIASKKHSNESKSMDDDNER